MDSGAIFKMIFIIYPLPVTINSHPKNLVLGLGKHPKTYPNNQIFWFDTQTQKILKGLGLKNFDIGKIQNLVFKPK